jgi:hypothetical protein
MLHEPNDISRAVIGEWRTRFSFNFALISKLYFSTRLVNLSIRDDYRAAVACPLPLRSPRPSETPRDLKGSRYPRSVSDYEVRDEEIARRDTRRRF